MYSAHSTPVNIYIVNANYQHAHRRWDNQCYNRVLSLYVVNKWVFKCFLNCSILFMFLILSGNEFHSIGAALAKAISPCVTWLVFGTTKTFLYWDLNPDFETNRSCKYEGALLFRHFHVISKYLNLFLLLAASLCSF